MRTPTFQRHYRMASDEILPGKGRLRPYALPIEPICADHAAITLTSAYEREAEQTAAVQLEKAGIRIAYELNRALGA